MTRIPRTSPPTEGKSCRSLNQTLWGPGSHLESLQLSTGFQVQMISDGQEHTYKGEHVVTFGYNGIFQVNKCSYIPECGSECRDTAKKCEEDGDEEEDEECGHVIAGRHTLSFFSETLLTP